MVSSIFYKNPSSLYCTITSSKKIDEENTKDIVLKRFEILAKSLDNLPKDLVKIIDDYTSIGFSSTDVIKFKDIVKSNNLSKQDEIKVWKELAESFEINFTDAIGKDYFSAFVQDKLVEGTYDFISEIKTKYPQKKLTAFLHRIIPLPTITNFLELTKQLEDWFKTPEHAKLFCDMKKYDVLNKYWHVFPSVICLLPCLEELFIKQHNFYSLPKEIGSMKTLKKIAIIGGQLNSLPKELFELPLLKEIIFCINKISVVPNSLMDRISSGTIDLIDVSYNRLNQKQINKLQTAAELGKKTNSKLRVFL